MTLALKPNEATADGVFSVGYAKTAINEKARHENAAPTSRMEIARHENARHEMGERYGIVGFNVPLDTL